MAERYAQGRGAATPGRRLRGPRAGRGERPARPTGWRPTRRTRWMPTRSTGLAAPELPAATPRRGKGRGRHSRPHEGSVGRSHLGSGQNAEDHGCRWNRPVRLRAVPAGIRVQPSLESAPAHPRASLPPHLVGLRAQSRLQAPASGAGAEMLHKRRATCYVLRRSVVWSSSSSWAAWLPRRRRRSGIRRTAPRERPRRCCTTTRKGASMPERTAGASFAAMIGARPGTRSAWRVARSMTCRPTRATRRCSRPPANSGSAGSSSVTTTAAPGRGAR